MLRCRKRERLPSEEAIHRHNVERVFDRKSEEIRLDKIEARARLDPIRAEVLARWDTGLEEATRGKIVRTWASSQPTRN